MKSEQEIHSIVAGAICAAMGRPKTHAGEIDLKQDLAYGYGLSSLDRIILMTTACKDAAIPLSEFGEEELSSALTGEHVAALLMSKHGRQVV
jgi:hypothetical protein